MHLRQHHVTITSVQRQHCSSRHPPACSPCPQNIWLITKVRPFEGPLIFQGIGRGDLEGGVYEGADRGNYRGCQAINSGRLAPWQRSAAAHFLHWPPALMALHQGPFSYLACQSGPRETFCLPSDNYNSRNSIVSQPRAADETCNCRLVAGGSAPGPVPLALGCAR